MHRASLSEKKRLKKRFMPNWLGFRRYFFYLSSGEAFRCSNRFLLFDVSIRNLSPQIIILSSLAKPSQKQQTHLNIYSCFPLFSINCGAHITYGLILVCLISGLSTRCSTCQIVQGFNRHIPNTCSQDELYCTAVVIAVLVSLETDIEHILS